MGCRLLVDCEEYKRLKMLMQKERLFKMKLSEKGISEPKSLIGEFTVLRCQKCRYRNGTVFR
jgi:hypothetical protein